MCTICRICNKICNKICRQYVQNMQRICRLLCKICRICKQICNKICTKYDINFVKNMQNMQKKYAKYVRSKTFQVCSKICKICNKYAKYVSQNFICRICTSHFADGPCRANFLEWISMKYFSSSESMYCLVSFRDIACTQSRLQLQYSLITWNLTGWAFAM